MALVRRANSELSIKDDYIDNYLAQGYDLIDESGNVIREGTPVDMASLKLKYAQARKAVSELQKAFEEQKNKVKELTQTVDALNAQLKTVKKKSSQ